MNQQKPRPVERHGLGKLEVTEIFTSIQGEGPFVGRPAVFVRMAGCNLACPECDTKYGTNYRMNEAEIVTEVECQADGKVSLVVITGGEPFRQGLKWLVTDLISKGYAVQMETNGTTFDPDFPYGKVTIVCSPKTPHISPSLWPHIDAYKYVAEAGYISEEDGLPLRVLGYPNAPVRPHKGFRKTVYLQPLDSGEEIKNTRNTKAVVASCLEHGHTFCLQLHKTLDME